MMMGHSRQILSPEDTHVTIVQREPIRSESKITAGSGTGFPRIYFNNGGDKDKLLTIEQWGTGHWTSMSSAFYGCSNLAGQASDAPDLSGVVYMSICSVMLLLSIRTSEAGTRAM